MAVEPQRMVDVSLSLPTDKVAEIKSLAARLDLSPGDVLLLGAAALALALAIKDRQGRLKAEYPGGRESEIHLA